MKTIKPVKKVLSNGTTVIFLKEEAQRTATALVLVEVGSKYESDKEAGIAHFLEHMCFKGTLKRPSAMDISSELDGMGAEYNAFTGHEYTGYYAKVAAPHAMKALDIISDVYCHSTLSEEDITKEKGVIQDEINMYEDVPMRKIGDLYMETLYGDQPAGRPIAGSKESVAKYTRKDFVKFREKHYVPRATTVVVSGSFDDVEAMKIIKDTFGKLADAPKADKKPIKDKQTKPVVRVLHKDSDQTHLVLGVRSMPLMHPDYPTLTVLACVLGGGMSSRLFHKVRVEMGLGYYVRASNDGFSDHGTLAAACGVDNARAKEVVPVLLGEFKKMADELVTKDELGRAKELLAGRLLMGLESSDEVADYFGSQWLMRKEFIAPEMMIKKVRAVKAEDIQALAKKLFLTKAYNLSVIGPWKESDWTI